MMKDNKELTMNGKASFYASIFEDLKMSAHKNGWALGLHGSLQNDMDIMAMPWTKDAVPVQKMLQDLSNDCFKDNVWQCKHLIPYIEKPNNRVVYTMTIYSDFYLDINVIEVIGNIHEVQE